jgi:F0F1-type ATP synthase membrane subunit b/b'
MNNGQVPMNQASMNQASMNNNGAELFENKPNASSGRFDVFEALDQLEDCIADSPRIPLSGRNLVSEDELLDQLDAIRLSLPSAFQEAAQLIQQRDEILTEAELYAQEIVSTAEKQAAAILNDMTIIRQAEQQAQQVRSQVEQECAALRSKTLSEIEQLQMQARREWEQMREDAITECQGIQQDADSYAEQVLSRMERQFAEMLGVLQNGRQQLYNKQQRLLDADPARRDVPNAPSIDAYGAPDPRGPRQAPPGPPMGNPVSNHPSAHRPIAPLQPQPRNPRLRR